MWEVKTCEVDEQKYDIVHINLKVFTICKHICTISLVGCILRMLFSGYIEHN